MELMINNKQYCTKTYIKAVFKTIMSGSKTLRRWLIVYDPKRKKTCEKAMSVYAFELSDVIYTYHVHVSKVHTILSIVLDNRKYYN